MKRICYIGSFKGPTDEGMRNLADSLVHAQQSRAEVIGVNPLDVVFRSGRVKRFKPDVVHYLSGPSPLSLMILRLARFMTDCKLTAVTATHPWLPGIRRLPSELEPDLIFVQSNRQRNTLGGLSKRLEFIPNGVDVNRFRPLNEAERMEARKALGIEDDAFAVLHVGNLREGRNTRILAELAKAHNTRVVLVSSTTVGLRSRRLRDHLQSAGVIIIDHFVPNVERVYGACDCYVFPTVETGRAIEIPLSVLEAIACNLPVISTKYGGLLDVLKPTTWVRFVDKPEDIPDELSALRKSILVGAAACNSRNQVLPIAWDEIANSMNQIYDISIAQMHDRVETANRRLGKEVV